MQTIFSKKFTSKSGILELMDDLGKAMADASPDTCMLGGGNPAHIQKIQKIYQNEMKDIVEDTDRFNRMIGNYSTPQGDEKFHQALAEYLNELYGWGVTSKNLMTFNGSQTSFFMLFNLLAGKMEDGTNKKIMLPMVPEYIGYADQGLDDIFVSNKPIIEKISKHEYKYKIDFDKLIIGDDVSALCISRPTNPTGNVATDKEISKLHELAIKKEIYLIIDNAYGAPFPNILFKNIKMIWDESIIHSFSLSKVGLPGTRTSFILASEEVINRLASVNAILSLASNNPGVEVIRRLIEDKQLSQISKQIITPYYKQKSDNAKSYFKKYMNDDIPYSLHVNEGAIFFWMWLKDFPITTYELYNRLKKRNVIIVPGKYFFPGFEKNDWKHKDECIRLAYAQDDKQVEGGIRIICEEVENAYGK